MISRFPDALGWRLCGVSILTLTAISVDRLLALLLGLRYRHVVTLRRVRVVIICSWFIGACLEYQYAFPEVISPTKPPLLSFPFRW